MIRPCRRKSGVYQIVLRYSQISTRGTRRFLSSTGNNDSTVSSGWSTDLTRIRNIGIIAHIDAGKTTTTERMLYYSGLTQRIGDVDEGSTVTDFLPAERARGITIQSAAVTFHWPPSGPKKAVAEDDTQLLPFRSLTPHVINLIDTPGHADFTFEVLRSLRVLDGAVCILDGVAGVEAQTEKVWHQASKYQIPRIIYVNKLDRDGAAFGKTVREIGARLMSWPAVCQIPWWDGGNGPFVGLGDVIRLCALRWETGGDGKAIKAFNIQELDLVDHNLAQELKKARIALVELLSEHDDELVEKFLDYNEDHLAIPATDIVHSLRRCLFDSSGMIVPVFGGASFKNIGVQPLLDAVVDLLPSPNERPDAEVAIGSTRTQLKEALSTKAPVVPSARGKNSQVIVSGANIEACALAFKVVNDARRGVLVYVRVYSGILNRNAVVFNTNLQVSERAQRLLKMYASDAVQVASIPAGQIGVIAGLAHTRTGDTLISCGVNIKKGPSAPFNTLQLRPIDVPPPVFFASMEPCSLSEERHLRECLALLLREDPSLTVSVDEESGQTLLSGMGELHLEIARDRLVKDFKAKAEMGGIEIGYRECLAGSSEPVYYLYEKDIAGRKAKAGCEAEARVLNDQALDRHPVDSNTSGTHAAVQRDGNLISIRIRDVDSSGRAIDPAQPSLSPHLTISTVQNALINGVLGGLVRGPNHAFPMHTTHINITLIPSRDLFGAETTTAALTSAARHATQAALTNAVAKAAGRTSLMEPVMKVIISVDKASLGAVMHDLSAARGGHVLSLDQPHTTTSSTSSSSSSSSPPSSSSDDNNDTTTQLPIDTRKIYAPPDPFETHSATATTTAVTTSTSNTTRSITARVPLKEMIGYLNRLRSLTAGRATFVMSFDRFEKMSAPRERLALEERRGWRF